MGNNLNTLFPSCVLDNDGILYFVTNIEHIIKKMDLKTGLIEYVNYPEGYNPEEWKGADRLFFDNSRLYLFEQNGKRILEYSLIENKGRCFEVDCDIYVGSNYAFCTIYQNILFVFLSFSNKMIKINLKNGMIERVEPLCTKIEYTFEKNKSLYFFNGTELEMPHKLLSCGCQVGDEIWLFSEKQFVLKYSLSTEKYIQYQLPENIKGCVHAIKKEGIFYILDLDGNIQTWNHINNKTEVFFKGRTEDKYPYFWKIAVTDENIWILPCFGEDIYIVNLRNRENKKYSKYPEDFCYNADPNRSKYYDYDEDTQNYYFAMHSANYMLIINKITGEEVWFNPVEPNLNEKIDYYKKYYRYRYKEMGLGIEGFLMLIESEKKYLHKKEKKRVGNLIWDKVN